MLGTATAKIAWVGRTASMVFGLALVMALVLVFAATAWSATEGNFILGKANIATTPTSLPPQCSDSIDNDSDGLIDFAGANGDPDCASATDNSESPDLTRPTVVSTNPPAGVTSVAPSTNVSATFSEAMDAITTDGDPSTIHGTTFKLVRLNADGTTTRVTAAVSYAAATKKAILNPASNLGLGRTYKATVTSGAQDLSGNALDQKPNIAGNQPKNWKFKVQ